VVRYRSFLESLSLSAATINLHLTAIRRLADEATESGCLSPELVTTTRRVNRHLYGRAWREHRRAPASTITDATVDWIWGLWF